MVQTHQLGKVLMQAFILQNMVHHLAVSFVHIIVVKASLGAVRGMVIIASVSNALASLHLVDFHLLLGFYTNSTPRTSMYAQLHKNSQIRPNLST
jgi:hypothetical protein